MDLQRVFGIQAQFIPVILFLFVIEESNTLGELHYVTCLQCSMRKFASFFIACSQLELFPCSYEAAVYLLLPSSGPCQQSQEASILFPPPAY